MICKYLGLKNHGKETVGPAAPRRVGHAAQNTPIRVSSCNCAEYENTEHYIEAENTKHKRGADEHDYEWSQILCV